MTRPLSNGGKKAVRVQSSRLRITRQESARFAERWCSYDFEPYFPPGLPRRLFFSRSLQLASFTGCLGQKGQLKWGFALAMFAGLARPALWYSKCAIDMGGNRSRVITLLLVFFLSSSFSQARQRNSRLVPFPILEQELFFFLSRASWRPFWIPPPSTFSIWRWENSPWSDLWMLFYFTDRSSQYAWIILLNDGACSNRVYHVPLCLSFPPSSAIS